MPKKEQESHLFNEVNNLRKPGPDIDQDAEDAKKINSTIFGVLAKSKKFEFTTLSIIVLNALFIGYDADFSARWKKSEKLYDCAGFKPGPGDPQPESGPVCYQFPIMENIFAVYFTAEVIIRFFAYKRKCDGLYDMWFVFDSTLVTFMVIETWILPIVGASGPLAQLSVLRLLRLLRITRMAKLMRFFPELQIILKGMVAAVRSVACTGVLMVMILYVWSILFTSEYHQGYDSDLSVKGTPSELFGSLEKSMRHLFIMGTILDDITYCCNFIRGSGQMGMLVMFIIFVLISSFTMLNMLIGILCEVVTATGEGERAKNTEAHVKEAITHLFKKMDEDKNGQISRDEFLSMKRDKNVMKALEELNVKSKHFEMYAGVMFQEDETTGLLPTLDFDQTIAMILRLRPGTSVSSLDFASFQQTVYKHHDRFKKHVVNLENMTRALSGKELGSPPPKKPAALANQSVAKVNEDAELDRTSDQEILAELQRRLGMNPSSAPVDSFLKQVLPSQVVDYPDAQAWSQETYTC
jgi:voltage-gated sodium channel